MHLDAHQFLGLPLLVGSPHAAAEWLLGQAIEPSHQPTIVEHVNVYNYFQIHRRPHLESELVARGVLLLEGIGMTLTAFCDHIFDMDILKSELSARPNYGIAR